MNILDSLRPKGSRTGGTRPTGMRPPGGRLFGGHASGSVNELPLLYVRDAVVFPNALLPVLAATKFCVAAADEAFKADKLLFVSLLKSLPSDGLNDISVHEIGTIAHIVQAVRLNDGSTRLLLEGRRRARLKRTVFRKEYLGAVIEDIDEGLEDGVADGRALDPSGDEAKETAALVQMVRKDFTTYAELVKKIPAETVYLVQRAEDPGRLCNLVANAMNVKVERKQELLAIVPATERLEASAGALAQEIELLSLQKKISQKVRVRMEKSQKDYFLQEQLKEINRELGKDTEENELVELQRRIEERQPPAEVLEKAKKELGRLGKLQPMSPESGVLRTYCEWIADLPWSDRNLDSKDLAEARAILDEDHYGLRKAKERILEFIAVRQLNPAIKGPILCLAGPPGTGKTSLGRSIARALGRDFVRVSLGGVRDEAEIRGHRKTYVGALPGKILQSMRKAGSTNPVFLLDEIDKMNSDFRGDPASALLEVLDPEQNSSFVDHYLEVPYDLSGVVFITTANGLHAIPYPLLDRMEVIEIPGYSENEKLEIARHFIIPRQLAENGLSGSGLCIRDEAIREVIRHYTMESGVRNLEREIARMIRKSAEKAVEAGFASNPEGVAGFKRIVKASTVPSLLGKRKHEHDLIFADPGTGLACGLAWTEQGGTVLPVEVTVFEGEGELILTGNLGDVMKESARTALSFIRSNAGLYGLEAKDFSGRTVHVHVPEGAIPKDGPSAGITLVAAILSAFVGRPVAAGWAMTGEITLTGRILAIGGVKEKVLAAHRNKVMRVLLPEANRKDLDDVPAETARVMEFRFAGTIAAALEILLAPAGNPDAPGLVIDTTGLETDNAGLETDNAGPVVEQQP